MGLQAFLDILRMQTTNLKLDSFYKNLPPKPYCTDDLGFLVVRGKDVAMNKRYIQHNPPCFTRYLIFDIDRPFGVMAWHDAGLPPPSWTTQNTENGHAHIAYELTAPVCTTAHARQDPLRYLAAVQASITRALGADVGYTNFITKNPLSDSWRTTVWREQPYSLGELAQNLDLTTPLTSQERQSGLGRNCTLFDTVRKWAYVEIRKFRGAGSWQNWFNAVLQRCKQVNQGFSHPLPYNEICHTAKSIAKYCWQNDTYAYNRFIERQAHKGSIGGLAKGIAYADKREQADQLRQQGLKQKEIAQILGVSTRTLRNWEKSGK